MLAVLALLAGGLIAVISAPGAGRAAARRAGHRRVALSLRAAGRRGGPTRSQLELAARYLGLPLARLRAGLAAGSSLAQLAARRPGRSRAGLLRALLLGRVQRIERERQRGRISAQRAEQRIAQIRLRVARVLALTASAAALR